MPTERGESKAAKVEDHPEDKRWPPVVARRLLSAVDSPDIRSQRVPELGTVLDEGVAHDLPLIVINELAVQRIDVNDKARCQRRKQPEKFPPKAALFLRRSHRLAAARRALR